MFLCSCCAKFEYYLGSPTLRPEGKGNHREYTAAAVQNAVLWIIMIGGSVINFCEEPLQVYQILLHLSFLPFPHLGRILI